jgi:hypothetical protein
MGPIGLGSSGEDGSRVAPSIARALELRHDEGVERMFGMAAGADRRVARGEGEP